MVCADEEAWDLLQTLSDLEVEKPISLRLGKATRRGYGKVTLWFEPVDGDGAHMWVQEPIAERVKEGREELTLTFLTDAVISDPWGRFVTGFKSEWLTRELGFSVQVIGGRAFATTHLLDGFNTKIRLPRWRDVALAAGSTVRLRLLEPYTSELQDRLQEIEREGVGLRRNEGYGRVAFEHPLYDSDGGLGDARIEIPAGLAEEAHLEGAKDETQEFRESWKKTLDGQTWSQCRDARFLGLARWLDARQHDAVEELIETLKASGEPDELLIECVGGTEERGDREIANPLTDEAGFELVERMLQRLRDADAPDQQMGISMVAERLAEAAGKKEEER
jgi:CRISPR-associated protein Csx10